MHHRTTPYTSYQCIPSLEGVEPGMGDLWEERCTEVNTCQSHGVTITSGLSPSNQLQQGQGSGSLQPLRQAEPEPCQSKRLHSVQMLLHLTAICVRLISSSVV